MPGPFPGMDPYLEDPALWPGVHLGLISGAEEALNAALPSNYVADIGERVYVVQPDRDLYPDVADVEHTPGSRRESAASGGAAVLERGAPPWVVTVDPVEVREPYVEVLALDEGRRLVSVLEFLSPSNKASGGKGRRLYQKKQRELLRSRTSLVEVDVLRAGAHTVAAPRLLLARRGAWDYLVCLHRGSERGRYEVWPVRLRERLPVIRVPLAGSDPDVELDLQAVLDRRYDAGGYAKKADYKRPPVPRLDRDDEAWAEALLRQHGSV